MTLSEGVATPPRRPRSLLLAQRIRGVMAELQIQQRDLAEALHMGASNLSRKVNGRVPMTPDEVQIVAEFLDVSEAYLYGFTNDRSRNEESPRPAVAGGGSFFVLPEPGTPSGTRTPNPLIGRIRRSAAATFDQPLWIEPVAEHLASVTTLPTRTARAAGDAANSGQWADVLPFRTNTTSRLRTRRASSQEQSA